MKPGSLPYIEVPTTRGTVKLLVDCGANVNIISKKWAYSANKKIISIPNKSLKGVTGNGVINEKILLNPFFPIIQTKFEFLILDFHPFFDGIIGTEIIFDDEFNLSSRKSVIQIQSNKGKIFEIPLKFDKPNPVP